MPNVPLHSGNANSVTILQFCNLEFEIYALDGAVKHPENLPFRRELEW